MTTEALVPFIRGAGILQLVVTAANFFLPRRLGLDEHLPRLPRILRQVFLVHWLYILIVLVLFAALCLFHAPELAGETALGRTLSATFAGFWLLRVVIQLAYYDRGFTHRHPAGHVAFVAVFTYLAAVFGTATLAGLFR